MDSSTARGAISLTPWLQPGEISQIQDPEPFQRFVPVDKKKPLETVQENSAVFDHRAEATVLMRSLRVPMILFEQGCTLPTMNRK